MELRDQLQRTLGGTYTIERELGGGGMSRVFVAAEQALGRRVVIKVLPPEMAAHVSTERFKREIMLAAQLQQANIVPLLSAGAADELPYYTMPFVEGESLRARLGREGELPVGEAIGILKEVARALAYAHHRGVVHRDIKPDNVLLSGGSAVVTDFGVAKALSASTNAGAAGLTSLGVALGTPAYMAPEQATADPATDHRADLYAFGVMAYEILAGQPPFAGRSPQATLAAQITELPDSLAKRRPNVPPQLVTLVMRCLEKRPSDRPQSATEVVQALDGIVTPSTGIHAELASRQPRGFAWSHPGMWVSVASLAVVAALVLWRMKSSERPVGDKSIAVMPFTSLGGAAVDSFFLEGMSEEIAGALGKVPGLKVVGSNSVHAAQAKGLDDHALGQLVGATSLLQGSVQRSGDRVRIIARLVSAESAVQSWGATYNFDFKDIFAIQDTIARAIAAELRVSFAGGSSPIVRVSTTNPRAHTLFLRGLYLWNRRTGQTMRQAISLFEQSVALDSSYAEAHAYVGMGEALLGTYGDIDERESLAAAEQAARRALAMDSTVAAAHAVLGWVNVAFYHNRAAEREYLRAIELNPSFATAHQWYSQLLGHLGRGDDAVREGTLAVNLDPQWPVLRNGLAARMYNAGRLADADTAIRALLREDPTFSLAYRTLTLIRLAQGRYAEADSAARQPSSEQSSFMSSLRGTALALGGHTGQAREVLRELLRRSQQQHVSAGAIAVLYDALGDREPAIRWLQRGVTEHDWFLRNYYSGSPILAHLQSDPRAAALLSSVVQP